MSVHQTHIDIDIHTYIYIYICNIHICIRMVDWKNISDQVAIAHSGTFDFYFGYTSYSEPARQMWENILLSVFSGAWDQTSWG
jgi:hypothetical protein